MSSEKMKSIIFLCLLSSTLQAQLIDARHYSALYHTPAAPIKYQAASNNTNEIQMVFSGLFLFYKFAFSSQDYNKCTFHPSCSEFGLLAVKKHGAIAGMLATLDRLQRCNGMSPELYTIDPERMLLIDHP